MRSPIAGNYNIHNFPAPNALYIKAELYRAQHVNQHYASSFALAALNDIYKCCCRRFIAYLATAAEIASGFSH